ncbi:DUF4873 domain-containing protein [Speluncibacter jeojiensis]|uniref:DUF4873 domain-containing protein n=1 Tax=Speluncibacter jeojiensis TaxID=2710754 RepID=A0A9X4M5H9_9ACTN|nr:DUF4873 domain-containing protein [Corynebacteriales bacterium D3-21]
MTATTRLPSDVIGVSAGSACEFDEDTDRWAVRHPDGAVEHPRILVWRGAGPSPRDHLVGRAGVTIGQAWRDGPHPFLGVAIAGFPNLFLLPGDRRLVTNARRRHIRGCVELMECAGATRIEVRSSVQRAFGRESRPVSGRAFRRRLRRVDPDDYELTSAADRADPDLYEGPAMLVVGPQRVPADVHLTGHLDPRDGHFHWYGRISRDPSTDTLTTPSTPAAALQIGDGPVRPARLTERDPWGNLRVTGIGIPPYPVGEDA